MDAISLLYQESFMQKQQNVQVQVQKGTKKLKYEEKRHTKTKVQK